MVFHFSARSETVIKAFDKMSFGFLACSLFIFVTFNIKKYTFAVIGFLLSYRNQGNRGKSGNFKCNPGKDHGNSSIFMVSQV